MEDFIVTDFEINWHGDIEINNVTVDYDSGDVVLLSIDMKQKRAQWEGFTVSDDGYPGLWICLSDDDAEDGTLIILTAYKHYTLFAATTFKYTLQVCLKRTT